MRKQRETPGKRLTIIIDEKTFKRLDIKIAQSDFFTDRGRYIDFLANLLPFIPDDVSPGDDVKPIIQKMAENAGIHTEKNQSSLENSEILQNNQDGEIDEETRQLREMGKDVLREFSNHYTIEKQGDRQ